MDSTEAPAGSIPSSLPSLSPPSSPVQVILLLSGSVFLSVFHSRFLVVALEKDISLEEARWGLLTFWIASGVLLVPMGWLADHVGRKRVFLIGMAVFPVGLIVEALSSNWKILIVAGLISAVGNSAAIPVGMAMLLAAVPARRRSTAVGGYYTMFGVVTIVSASVIAWADKINWNLMIPVYVLIGAITIWLGRNRLVEATDGDDHETSLRVGNLPISSKQIIPQMTPSLRKLWTKNMVLANCCEFAWVSAMGFISFAVSLYLIHAFSRGLSIERAVFLLASIPIGVIALPLLVGRFADKKGHRGLILVAVTFLVVFSLLSALLTDGRYIPSILWFGYMIAFIINIGVASTVIEGAAVRSLPMERLGVGVAIHSFFSYLGSIVSIYTSIFVLWVVSDYQEEQRWLFGLGALCAVGAIALASGIDTRTGVRQPADKMDSATTD
ncbi:MFS transporter [Candidatus Poriferisocius sp.]|uniref:MFS transporter n=1 Tax=Candidatus Poriferisocius sp. TaxID=3101276 RepID=UPI003B0166EB